MNIVLLTQQNRHQVEGMKDQGVVPFLRQQRRLFPFTALDRFGLELRLFDSALQAGLLRKGRIQSNLSAMEPEEKKRKARPSNSTIVRTPRKVAVR